MNKNIIIDHEWKLLEPLGSGGFGSVFRAESELGEFALKLIPDGPGAEREILFADQFKVQNSPNAIPIIEHGSVDDYSLNGAAPRDFLVLVMPIAEMSLRDALKKDFVDRDEKLKVLIDLAECLNGIKGKVVHRDIKPENILFYDGKWCLADFGIAKFAEATTAAETFKEAMTSVYAAPERLKLEKSDFSSDIFSFGVIAYELYEGKLPYPGPNRGDVIKQQNIGHSELVNADKIMASIIERCLFYSSGARPSPSKVLDRLSNVSNSSSDIVSLASLSEAGHNFSRAQSEEQREKIVNQEKEKERSLIAKDGKEQYGKMLDILVKKFKEAVPEINVSRPSSAVRSTWIAPGYRTAAGGSLKCKLQLGDAVLEISEPEYFSTDVWKDWKPSFDVVSCATIRVRIPKNQDGYTGRSHSLWFCDAKEEGYFDWYETSFMDQALMRKSEQRTEMPFALDPSVIAGKALSSVMTEYQVAYPFTLLDDNTLNSLIERWGDYLASAYRGNLHRPSTLPEIKSNGTWRRN